VIDINEAQVRTLQQVRQVLAGTQAIEFKAASNDAGRYAWIESVLRRFDYRQMARGGRGAMLTYVQRLSGYSRAQVTRLVARWVRGKPLVKNYGAPKPPLRGATRSWMWLCWSMWTRHGHAVGSGHGVRAAPSARRLRG